MDRNGRWICWAVVAATLAVASTACRSKPATHPHGSEQQAPTQQPSSAADIAAIQQLLDGGKDLIRSGQSQRAELSFQQAVQLASALTPSDPNLLSEALAEQASCLVVLERPAEARQLIQEALPLVQRGTLEGQKREFQLQMTLAESYRYEERDEFALAPFRAALQASSLAQHERELVGRHTEASSRLAVTLQRCGRHAEAAQALEQALVMARRNAQVADSSRLTVQLAFSYLQLHEVARAVTLLQTIDAHGRRLRTSDMTFSDVALEEFLPERPVPDGNAPAPPAPMPPATATSPTVTNAARRVGEMRSDFRYCYHAALTTNGQLQGASRIVIKVAADGRVAEAKALGVGVPVEMVECLLRRAVASQFDPPEGGAAIIAVPLTFVKQ